MPRWCQALPASTALIRSHVCRNRPIMLNVCLDFEYEIAVTGVFLAFSLFRCTWPSGGMQISAADPLPMSQTRARLALAEVRRCSSRGPRGQITTGRRCNGGLSVNDSFVVCGRGARETRGGERAVMASRRSLTARNTS
jgi:hypothetical protein